VGDNGPHAFVDGFDPPFWRGDMGELRDTTENSTSGLIFLTVMTA